MRKKKSTAAKALGRRRVPVRAVKLLRQHAASLRFKAGIRAGDTEPRRRRERQSMLDAAQTLETVADVVRGLKMAELENLNVMRVC